MRIESSALDLLWGAVITNYWGKGLERIRKVTHIAEITPPKIGEGTTYKNVFTWNEVEDKFYPDNIDELFNISPKINSIYNAKEEILRKKRIIENCIRLNFLKFSTVSAVVKLYYTQKIEIEEMLEKGKIEEIEKISKEESDKNENKI